MSLRFLRKLSEDNITNHSLVELLNTRLAGKESARSHKEVHTSAITDDDLGFCPRQYALLDMLEQKLPPKYINAATRVAFDNGNALHDLCRNRWLRDDVIGGWKCRACKSPKTVKHFTKLPKVPCACGVEDWEYFEEAFVDPETKITGSIDFFIDIGSGKLLPVEAKSIDKDQFNALAGPLGKHRVRTQMYLALIDRAAPAMVKDQIDLTQGRVLYISKGFGKKHVDFDKVLPFKEFAVTRNDSAVEPYFKLGKEVQAFREGGPIPLAICDSHQHKRAKACPVCKSCFSGKYPGGMVL